MNELQKVEFDLFRCFVEICEKLNLNYFLVCGSALGAARHEGFIPWDDDLDVGMYREDYDKFMALAPSFLPKGIFLQNYKSDPNFPYVYAKLRNSNTTYIQTILKNLKHNHGIYMDIFPLDGYPLSWLEQKKLSFLKKQYSRATLFVTSTPITFKGKIYHKVAKLIGLHKRTAKTLEKYENLISKYPVKGAKMICNHGTWYGDRDYILAEYYGKGSSAIFEGMEVCVPEDCNGYLTALFGDWRTPPPPEKQVGSHDYEVCDTEKSYTYYIK